MTARRLPVALMALLVLQFPAYLPAAEGPPSRPTVSRELAPILKRAQNALMVKDFDQALEILKSTDTMPKSEYEERVIAQLRYAASAKIQPRFVSPSDLKPQQ